MIVRTIGIAAAVVIALAGAACGGDEGSQRPTTPRPGDDAGTTAGDAGTTGIPESTNPPPDSSPLSQGIDEALSQGGSTPPAAQRTIEPLSASDAAEFERGVRAFEQNNDPESARSAFQSVLSSNPTAYRAAYNLGYLAERQGDTREAILEYQRALDIKPDYPTALRALFRLLARVGRASDGLAQVQSRAQAFPENNDVQEVLAEALIEAGRPAEGEAIARRLLQVDANSLPGHEILLKAAIAQGQRALIDELLGWIEAKLTETVPSDECSGGGEPQNRSQCKLWAFCYYTRAQAAAARGGRFEAHQWYLKVIDADPTFVEARVQAASFFLDVGQLDEAVPQLEAARRLAPTWLPVLVGLGNAYRGRGDYAGAMQQLREAARLYPTAAEVFIAMGLVYYDARTASFEGLDRAQSDQTALQNFRQAQQLLGSEGADDTEITALLAAAQQDYDITTAPPPTPIEEPGGGTDTGGSWGEEGGAEGGGTEGGGWDEGGGAEGGGWGEEGGGATESGGGMDSGGW